MSRFEFIRNALPQDAVRIYTRLCYPQEMELYRRLRSQDPADPGMVSLKPFIDRQAIFFHIPKCAGISVSRELFGCRGGGHMTLHAYKNAFSAREFNSFYKFTFVRNPWDRVVSAYHFLTKGGMNAQDEKRAESSVRRYPDFTSFVEGYLSQPIPPADLHFLPQYSFLCTGPGTSPEVDFIGRYESIEADFKTIASRLGMQVALPHRNATGARPADYRQVYTDRTAEIVAQAYARDIELFGYDF